VLRLAFFFFSRLRGIPFKTSHSFIYHSTPFHLDSIIAGCLLGLYWMECRDPIRFRIRFWVLFLVGAIASSIMLWFTREQSALYCFSFTFLAMLFAGLVGLTLLGWNRAMFVNPALRYFGKISYGFYLIHYPIVSVFQSHPILHKIFPFRSVFLMELAGVVCATALSFGLATLSWYVLERPILSLKDRLAP
jgi:peptidoglycan/LPS O-acetylase OafA/YrhL